MIPAPNVGPGDKAGVLEDGVRRRGLAYVVGRVGDEWEREGFDRTKRRLVAVSTEAVPATGTENRSDMGGNPASFVTVSTVVRSRQGHMTSAQTGLTGCGAKIGP